MLDLWANKLVYVGSFLARERRGNHGLYLKSSPVHRAMPNPKG